MKNKVYILLGVCALATLSFTFVSKNNQKVVTKVQQTEEAPAGGLLSEDKF